MFSREKTGAALPKASRSGPAGLSFIGPEVLVSGDLATDAQLHVDGRIDGNVRCSQLVQGEAGIIAGNIQAEEARLAGTVEGQVNVRTLLVEASARILGDVTYETISMDAGAQLEGRLARRAALGLDEAPLIATPVSFSPGRGKSAKTTDDAGGDQADIFVKSA
ncbi:MAG TPA: polymer-forming cytoskeletal protein [Allosphingosinicella sp.]|nr:polymer-forming cytoskeletal protein [Allosphingosinicella sp.]